MINYSVSNFFDYSKIKTLKVEQNSFVPIINIGLSIYFIHFGKHYWSVNNEPKTMLPNDILVLFNNQLLVSENNCWHLGQVSAIHINVNSKSALQKSEEAHWKGINYAELTQIIALFTSNPVVFIQNFKDLGSIFSEIEKEFTEMTLGYHTRLNQLIYELMIRTARKLTVVNNTANSESEAFSKLELTLKQNLSHNWTVDEMAKIMNFRKTTFTERTKKMFGFSPLNYLINLRILEGVRLLKNTKISLTQIALELGFYSSQHFSSTFKRHFGYPPCSLRKV